MSDFPNGTLVCTLHQLTRRLARWLVGRIDLLDGSLPEDSPVRSLRYFSSGEPLGAGTENCYPDCKCLAGVLPKPLDSRRSAAFRYTVS